MGLYNLFVLMNLLFLLSCFHLIMPLCHDDESSALLQFKQSFSINKSASYDPSAYPKVASWKLRHGESNTNDCCSWDGVECDEGTGHVIGLDLSSSLLYGSINSNSSLFRLVHLQRLHLADNDFNYSQIPSGIGHLSQLTSLNLSFSVFSGQIPLEISLLTQLASLDLSRNLLKLQKLGLTTLVQNLTKISELSLSDVNISSQVPDTLANLPSLTSILLKNCGLHGEFPMGIFHLPNLQALSVRFNQYLTGYLPEFHHSNSLKILKLAGTNFSGKLPDSIGNLSALNQLDLGECYFSGSLPASLSNLTQLTKLNLSICYLYGSLPTSLNNLTQLNILDLRSNNFSGQIPSLASLSQLTYLDLDSNQLAGQIPSWLMNLTQLTYIDLSDNHLHGPVPSSFSKFKNLSFLSLHSNKLSGTIDIDVFLKLKNLGVLQLSDINLSLHTSNISYGANATLPKFWLLSLESCNLSEFPYFLRFQDELEMLSLDNNSIHGQIPEWVWNSSIETLGTISLSNNFLTSFDKRPTVLPWTTLGILDLSFNMLQGPLPIPPLSTFSYEVSHNRLTGEVPKLICQLSSLYTLDLSNNKFSGEIPQCLGNFSNSLSVLNLKGNNFSGTIPQTYSIRSKLRMIDLSQNQLQGQIPRSMANCTMLEILDLGNNQIEDTFPFWLWALSELQVLILRSNKFHGAIGNPKTNLKFPKLRIIDLSDNGFTGDLPQEFFQKIVDITRVTYLKANIHFLLHGSNWDDSYDYSISLTNKGVKLAYEKILNIFTAIDLSSNKFKGQIPEYIGNLKGLQLLNLSGNDLIGSIPSSLGNLTNLESLDLSQNMLSGEIPWQLAQLNFLAFLNVSYNNLTGPIPSGEQFDTFQNNSYQGNSGLCGEPLSKKCEISPSVPPLTIEEGNDSKFPNDEFDWIFIFAGYGSGLVVGLVIGHTLTTRYHEWFQNNWFVKTFGRRQRKRRRKEGQRN